MDQFGLEFESVKGRIHQALRAWQSLEPEPTSLLIDLLLITTSRPKIAFASAAEQRLATNSLLLNYIELLQQPSSLKADVLTRRFIDGNSAQSVAYALNLSVDQVNRLQRSGMGELAETIYKDEIAARAGYVQEIEESFEASNSSELFGVNQLSVEIEKKLVHLNAPWIITIGGIGGIGKTSLANLVARRILRSFIFDRIAWIRHESTNLEGADTLSFARRSLLHQLAAELCPDLPGDASDKQRRYQVSQILKSQPHLIIIDNLEEAADTAQVIEQLHAWSNPSKFLITTRTPAAGATGVLNINLDELSFEYALDLVRDRASIAALPILAAIDEEGMRPLYEIVGGNPLAIELIVGLAAVFSLSEVLDDLKQVNTRKTADLYRHIYLKAWHALSMNAQQLLETMPMAAEAGSRLVQLAAMSRLEKGQVMQAIQELVGRSLLEVRGNAHERRYGIHQLTKTFLQTDIIHWPTKYA